jgi:hypothetical protein
VTSGIDQNRTPWQFPETTIAMNQTNKPRIGRPRINQKLKRRNFSIKIHPHVWAAAATLSKQSLGRKNRSRMVELQIIESCNKSGVAIRPAPNLKLGA